MQWGFDGMSCASFVVNEMRIVAAIPSSVNLLEILKVKHLDLDTGTL